MSFNFLRKFVVVVFSLVPWCCKNSFHSHVFRLFSIVSKTNSDDQTLPEIGNQPFYSSIWNFHLDFSAQNEDDPNIYWLHSWKSREHRIIRWFMIFRLPTDQFNCIPFIYHTYINVYPFWISSYRRDRLIFCNYISKKHKICSSSITSQWVSGWI